MKKIITCALIIVFFLIGCSSNSNGYQKVNIPDEKLGSVELPLDWDFVESDGWISIINSDTQESLAIEEYHGMYGEWAYNEYFESYSRIELISSDYSGSTGAHFSLYRFSTPDGEMELYTIFMQSNNDPGYSTSFVFLVEAMDTTILQEIIASYSYARI
ncbi:MAG: hypothetical protein AB7U79_04510 [Candidatus Izemoplasmatales bacterium]